MKKRTALILAALFLFLLTAGAGAESDASTPMPIHTMEPTQAPETAPPDRALEYAQSVITVEEMEALLATRLEDGRTFGQSLEELGVLESFRTAAPGMMVQMLNAQAVLEKISQADVQRMLDAMQASMKGLTGADNFALNPNAGMDPNGGMMGPNGGMMGSNGGMMNGMSGGMMGSNGGMMNGMTGGMMGPSSGMMNGMAGGMMGGMIGFSGGMSPYGWMPGPYVWMSVPYGFMMSPYVVMMVYPYMPYPYMMNSMMGGEGGMMNNGQNQIPGQNNQGLPGSDAAPDVGPDAAPETTPLPTTDPHHVN